MNVLVAVAVNVLVAVAEAVAVNVLVAVAVVVAEAVIAQNANILEPLFFKNAVFWPLKVKISKRFIK